MARTVNQEEFAAKRREILEAANRLVFTKGFEQMSIRDIQNELNISSGAFHHYFGSREALLDAYIQRIKDESSKPILPILHDPHRTAIEKFQGFFNTLDSLRLAHSAEIIRLSQVWYTDANALVRQKVDEALLQQRAPMITEIVYQGIREGVFNTAYPDRAGEVILTLLQGMGNVHAKLMLELAQKINGEEQRIREIVNDVVSVYTAYMDAVERVLGAPPNSLSRTDVESVNIWVKAMRGEENQ